MPGADQHPLEFRHVAKKLLALGFGAEAHDPLDAGAVVPAAVEQHDFTARRQVRDIALEIPLGALALGRGRQGDDLADPWVEPLGDSLDDPALAGSVAALEQHDQFEFLVNNPILQFDQFPLQSQQFAEIGAAVERVSLVASGATGPRTESRR